MTYNATYDGVNVVEVNAAPAMGYTVNVTDLDDTPALEQPSRLRIQAAPGQRVHRRLLPLPV